MQLGRYIWFWLYLALVVVTVLPGSAQQVIDDFEQSNLDAWLTVEGIAQISDVYAYADLLSVELSGTNVPSIIRHKTFVEAAGKYRMKCYVVDENTEARLRFQYISESNYYEVVSRPQGTKQPILGLYKVVSGQSQLLGEVPALVALHNWYQITIHRTCAGEILVFTNDVLQIAVNDTDLLEAGSIGLGSWRGSTYFDDITYDNDRGDIMLEIDTSICAGSILHIGSRKYSQEGTYEDTIRVMDQCDSIIHVKLAISQAQEYHRSDTICGDGLYVFGGDTLLSSGTYRKSWIAQNGCDSIINLTFWRLTGDTFDTDSTLCMGESILFAGELRSKPGIYYDTIYQADCYGVVALRLQLVDAQDFLGPNMAICFRSSDVVSLNHPSLVDVRWSDGSTSPVLQITEPGLYWGEISQGSCTRRDSIIFEEACDTPQGLYVPNAFSPNGDGYNDYFFPGFDVAPQRFLLKIFNRYGQIIYSSRNPTPGWNGQIEGRELPSGTYVYVIEADEQQVSGEVTLIR